MKEKFEDRTFSGDIKIKLDEVRIWAADKLSLCQHMIAIVEEYGRKGFSLSLRQLYYQLVSKELIPNHDKVYKKIGGLKDDIAYSGNLDWDLLEDRGRVPHSVFSVDNIKHGLTIIWEQYRLNRQLGQPVYVEVWTEKDAISDIIKRATNKFGTMLCINKGYTSSSAIYAAYQRFSEVLLEKRKVKILYLGDHDPSGLDMIRDIRDRLLMMLSQGEFRSEAYDLMWRWWDNGGYTLYDVVSREFASEKVTRLLNGESENEKLQEEFERGQFRMWIESEDLFEVIQIGLTMDQIKLYNPPPNPAKITDPRAVGYIKKYGNISWEVDALKPEVIVKLVSDSIAEIIDMDVFQNMLDQESDEKSELKTIIDKY